MTSMLRALIWLAAAALAACDLLAGKPVDPMPTIVLPARQSVRDGRVVIVLPGRADDLEGLRRTGIVEAIQSGDPGASVILAGATMPYYMDGGLVRRLHDQIIAPARARGDRQIWIAGASLGGMGALMYEREHPGEVAGLLLMAPYLGEASLVQEISDAGGPLRWDPGPPPAQLDRDSVPREEWRVVKSWTDRPELARRVWLVCGDEDRFIEAARLVAPILPQGHFQALHGPHAWTVWNVGAAEVFRQLSRATATD